jgi:universal stress protein E
MSTARWKSILVVIADPFARAQPALSKAAEVARRSGARVLLFNSFMVPQPVADAPMDSHEEIIASAIRQRRARLRELAAGTRLRRTQCMVRWDYPAHEAIVRQVLSSKPDLLITDSHRRGRLARLVLSNTDWELMRTCPCPMWFVRSSKLPRRPKVLVAVDPRHAHAKPTRLDDRLLQVATVVAAQFDARVGVVHAYEAPASAAPGMLMEPIRLPISPQRARDFVAETQRLVQSLCSKHDIAAVNCTIQEGTARDVIAATVRRQTVDVLVMGAVSRSVLARPIIGSTAEVVIDHVDCDVLVVKPAGFRTPVTHRQHKA